METKGFRNLVNDKNMFLLCSANHPDNLSVLPRTLDVEERSRNSCMQRVDNKIKAVSFSRVSYLRNKDDLAKYVFRLL